MFAVLLIKKVMFFSFLFIDINIININNINKGIRMYKIILYTWK